MEYTVVRCDPDGRRTAIIAECKWIADAEAVLRNWHVGYIARNGEIVRVMNTDFGIG